MNRRGFLRATATVISVMALAGRLKLREPEPNIRPLMPLSEEHLEQWHKDVGDRVAKALADSMIQTREITMAEAIKGAPEYAHQVFGTRMWWKV